MYTVEAHTDLLVASMQPNRKELVHHLPQKRRLIVIGLVDLLFRRVAVSALCRKCNGNTATHISGFIQDLQICGTGRYTFHRTYGLRLPYGRS